MDGTDPTSLAADGRTYYGLTIDYHGRKHSNDILLLCLGVWYLTQS